MLMCGRETVGWRKERIATAASGLAMTSLGRSVQMDLRLDVPGLSGNVEKDVKNLSNYVFRLSEDLRYLLYNLDVTNFNDLGLARYENGRLQIYTEKLQLAVKEIEAELIDGENGLKAQIAADAEALRLSFENAEKDLAAAYKLSAEGLSAKITQELGTAKDGIDEKVAQWQLTVDGFSAAFTTKLGEVRQTMTQWQQDAERFKAYVETAEGKIASWEVTENKISSLVQAIGSDGSTLRSTIIQEIRDDESLIQLIADKVEIEGVLTVSAMKDALVDGETVINGDNIQTGTINGASFIACGEMDGDDEYYAFMVEDGYANTVGWIGYGYQSGKYEDDGNYGDKLWLRTEEYRDGGTDYYPSIKLSAAGNISMEALGHEEGLVYIAANDYVTLDGGSNGVYIYDNSGTEWQFVNGTLCRNGEPVLP